MRAAALTITAVLAASCVKDKPIVLTPQQERTIREHILTQAPTTSHPVGALFGDSVRLLGFDAKPARAKVSESFALTWYWESVKVLDDDWMIFVHFDAQGRKNRINLDHHAVKGLYDVRRWKPGEIIRDVQNVRIPSDFPPGKADLWVGFWRAEDRLRVTGDAKTDDDDRVLAGTIEVISQGVRPVPSMKVPHTTGPLKADGKLDEPDWATAPKTGRFVAPLDDGKPVRSTEARLLWDEQYLYIAFECEDPDAATTFTETDDNLWEQDAVEVFIDPDRDGKTYAEIQVSPSNVLFDASFERHRSDLALARKWTSGTRHGVVVDGTLNVRDDTDRGWTAELAIPWDQLPSPGDLPPRPGAAIHLNLFRLDRAKDGKQDAGAWSAPFRPDFHALDRFARITLQAPEPTAPAP